MQNANATLSAGGERSRAPGVGRGQKPDAAGAANRVRQDHCLCQDHRGRSPQRQPGADPGTPGRTAPAGGGQAGTHLRSEMCRGKGRADLSGRVVSCHGRQRSDPHAAETPCPVSAGLLPDHYHRRGTPRHFRQLSGDTGSLFQCPCAGRDGNARPGRQAESGQGIRQPGV